MNAKTLLLLLGIALASTAAEGPAIKVVLPDRLIFTSPPGIPDLKSAYVLGSESEPGAYAIRVKLKAGGRVPVHTHPDTRYSTVLSGVLYVGFGEVANDARMTAVPAGAVYVAPANVPHYLWAKDGEVQYQEAGVGPTGTKIQAAAP
jgi:quercetin dioxygenase-like cupin family protein